jgi:hypothetical protein
MNNEQIQQALNGPAAVRTNKALGPLVTRDAIAAGVGMHAGNQAPDTRPDPAKILSRMRQVPHAEAQAHNQAGYRATPESNAAQQAVAQGTHPNMAEGQVTSADQRVAGALMHIPDHQLTAFRQFLQRAKAAPAVPVEARPHNVG